MKSTGWLGMLRRRTIWSTMWQ